MSLLNIISVPTNNGLKSIEIHRNDITKFNFDVDILVISAFRNGYSPIPNTVIGSLKENCGLDVSELAHNPLIDLRSSLDFWLSKVFKHVFLLNKSLCFFN